MNIPWEKTVFPEGCQLDSLVTCTICKEPFSAPVVSSICHHSYCSFCIRNSLSTKNSCPVCNVELLESQIVKVPVLEEITRWYTFNSSRLYALVKKLENPDPKDSTGDNAQPKDDEIKELVEVKFASELGPRKTSPSDDSLISPSSNSKYFYIPRKLTEQPDTKKQKPKRSRKTISGFITKKSTTSVPKKEIENQVVVISDNESVNENFSDGVVEISDYGSTSEYFGKKKEYHDVDGGGLKDDEKDKKIETLDEEKHDSLIVNNNDESNLLINSSNKKNSLQNFLKKTPSVLPSSSSVLSTTRDNSSSDDPGSKKLPKLNFSMLSVPKIKEKFKKYNIPTPTHNGNSKHHLAAYYNQYLVLWNSNLDSNYPISKAQISARLREWERIQNLDQHNQRLRQDFGEGNSTNNQQRKEYNRTGSRNWMNKYKDEFNELVRRAKESKARSKAGEVE
ncbi:E3 ubiquitin-protein ligase [Saccharomycopsis crataegensis]|uniref:E3 ubiquitin-protein ligase n=1 Tax=Saccharomycopsis crataegensis TaxID=43959 RepID=A0AAV5QLJ8_9ASCO|nr:E3 ubiquitin-protein ligase [Saccharomycopsis crataegensis]